MTMLDGNDVALCVIALIERGPKSEDVFDVLTEGISDQNVGALLGAALGLIWDLGQKEPELVAAHLAERRALVLAEIAGAP
jgi:hypothetical protein